MKRLFAIVLAFTLAMSIASVCQAAIGDPVIQPFYTDITMITSTLSIDSSGNASCGGRVTARSADTKSTVTIKLMKKSGTTWSEVKSWSGSGTGKNGAAASGSVKVTKGYTYKVVATGKITDLNGKLLESDSKDSPMQTY